MTLADIVLKIKIIRENQQYTSIDLEITVHRDEAYWYKSVEGEINKFMLLYYLKKLFEIKPLDELERQQIIDAQNDIYSLIHGLKFGLSIDAIKKEVDLLHCKANRMLSIAATFDASLINHPQADLNKKYHSYHHPYTNLLQCTLRNKELNSYRRVKMLLEKGVAISDMDFIEATNVDVEAVKLLLDAGYRCSAKAFKSLIDFNKIEICQLLRSSNNIESRIMCELYPCISPGAVTCPINKINFVCVS